MEERGGGGRGWKKVRGMMKNENGWNLEVV